ncbi:MAG: 50S ribosomal protein L15 [Candidatus Omnitrophica bacterium]|nr:50S ribosomal protein L15 [Candidatus Omnitrophota bacterium]
MQLHELKPPRGSTTRKVIVGRGKGSGHGKTSGRGRDGQGSRGGPGILGALEGGQMPLIRRLAKVGFRSKRPILNQIVSLASLNRLDKGTVINAEILKKEGFIESINKPFKILGDGDIEKALIFQTDCLSASAKEKILKAGGKIDVKEAKVAVKKPAQKQK